MKSLFFVIAIFTFNLASAATPEQISTNLNEEFQRLRQIVSEMEPDYEIAGFMKVKDLGDHKLIWRLSEDGEDGESIRIKRDTFMPNAFQVWYVTSDLISPGRRVLRRFVGPSMSGWQNHTIDFNTLEFLGSQGIGQLHLSETDREMMSDWNITLF